MRRPPCAAAQWPCADHGGAAGPRSPLGAWDDGSPARSPRPASMPPRRDPAQPGPPPNPIGWHPIGASAQVPPSPSVGAAGGPGLCLANDVQGARERAEGGQWKGRGCTSGLGGNSDSKVIRRGVSSRRLDDSLGRWPGRTDLPEGWYWELYEGKAVLTRSRSTCAPIRIDVESLMRQRPAPPTLGHIAALLWPVSPDCVRRWGGCNAYTTMRRQKC